jgi:hypothetical protein
VKKRINVELTPYEGDQPFPEAASYSEFVAERLEERYDAEVCTYVDSRTRVHLYGFTADLSEAGQRVVVDLEHEIKCLVENELWDEFCSGGYRAYTIVATA